MLRTLPHIQSNRTALRVAGVLLFALLTAISAKISIPMEPVPFTMQVLVVLLSGLVLGARDGALSQMAYISLIVMGLPVDARGLGAAALFGPTGGYLLGFAAAAFTAGWLVERAGARLWQRWLAGVAGVAVIYVVGVSHLRLYTGMDWQAAFAAGAAPFLLLDGVKALLAAGLTESARAWLLRR